MQRPRGKNDFGQEHRVKLERRQGPGPIVFAPQHAELRYLLSSVSIWGHRGYRGLVSRPS